MFLLNIWGTHPWPHHRVKDDELNKRGLYKQWNWSQRQSCLFVISNRQTYFVHEMGKVIMEGEKRRRVCVCVPLFSKTCFFLEYLSRIYLKYMKQ